MNWGKAIEHLGGALIVVAVTCFGAVIFWTFLETRDLPWVDRDFSTLKVTFPYAVGTGILGYLMQAFGDGLTQPKSKTDTKD